MLVEQQPLHHHHIGAAASADADDMDSSSTDDDQKAFELSQYTPLGVEHFSAPYRNDPSALERLSRRISHRVEQDSSDLITFCDKRIRRRRKKQKEQSKSKTRQHQQEEERSYHDGTAFSSSSSSAGPEIVSASDLMLGKCLGQGSFSSVFVLEKHLHRPPSVTAPRRGRRSRLSTGTNQGSTSRRGSSMRLDMCNSTHSNNNSMSTHSASRHTIATTTPAKSRTGRSPTGLRRRLRQEYKSINDVPNGNDGSHRSLDNSSSQRSRSLSPRRSPPKKNNDGSRSRSLSRSIRNGIRACFGKSPLNHSFDNEMDEENFYRQKIKRNSNESIFRGGSRSLSCRKRRSRTRRSRSQDGLANTSRTSLNTDFDNNSIHSCDAALSQTPHRGVLWKKNFPDEEIDDSCGGADSNLVVKILQPKLMDQPKLFANCAAGLIREGLFLAAIDHPHVLKVHAWTSPNAWMDFPALASKEGDLYDGYILVLERLKGGSLKGWMNRWQLEHREEQRALAAVAAMEADERQKRERGHRRHRMRRSLSLSSSSDESASFSPSNNPSLMASKYRRSLDSEFAAASAAATATAAAAAVEEAAPVSPGHSPKAQFDAAYLNQHNNRSYPYTTCWPKTQLSDRASILLQLSDTVKYLHKHRILHRDLKPDNLGVTFGDNHNNGSKQKQYASTLSLKVFDFDIARLVPEEPKEVVDLPYKKKKVKRNSCGSVNSFDPEMLNNNQSNRSGRSISPFRTSASLTGDKQVRRRVKGKYRGQRPRPGVETADAAETHTKTEPAVPTEVAIDTETPLKPVPQRDALFEMTAKMGSPRYMAPEIARGEPYNLRSEVYTVCLLVHEVLTLQKPYDELQPEDHGRLVHFDLPGYRPPIFSDWKWPSELEEILHMGWGDISQRPSMKEVHSVLKRALPKLCPEVGKQQTQESSSTAPEGPSQKALETQPKKSNKGRGIFHRTPKKKSKHSRKSSRSSSLTPTASNSDFSFSDDDPLKTVE